MNRVFILMLCLASLCGCNRTQSGDASPAITSSTTDNNVQTYVYECSGDFSFVARTEAERAWLFLPGNTVNLLQVRSASGVKYSDGRFTFWIKDDEASIESKQIRYSGCRNNRARAIWEHAKLNGVDFRALGNEPGWYLEISNKQDILLVTDYGQQTYRFTSALINSQPGSRTTTYSASNYDGMIEVTIRSDRCRDSMSGEEFSASVSVVVGDKRYTGCGKALH